MEEKLQEEKDKLKSVEAELTKLSTSHEQKSHQLEKPFCLNCVFSTNITITPNISADKSRRTAKYVFVGFAPFCHFKPLTPGGVT